MIIMLLQTAELASKIFESLEEGSEEIRRSYDLLAAYQNGELVQNDKYKYSIIER